MPSHLWKGDSSGVCQIFRLCYCSETAWRDDSSIPLTATKGGACLAEHVAVAAGVALNDAPKMLAQCVSIFFQLYELSEL